MTDRQVDDISLDLGWAGRSVSTDQYKHKGYTPNPKIGIKIPDPAENQIQAARLKGRDSADHAMAADSSTCYCRENNILCSSLFLKL